MHNYYFDVCLCRKCECVGKTTKTIQVFTVTFLFTFNHLPYLSEQQLVSMTLLQILKFNPGSKYVFKPFIKNIRNINNSFFT